LCGSAFVENDLSGRGVRLVDQALETASVPNTRDIVETATS